MFCFSRRQYTEDELRAKDVRLHSGERAYMEAKKFVPAKFAHGDLVRRRSDNRQGIIVQVYTSIPVTCPNNAFYDVEFGGITSRFRDEVEFE